MSEISRLARDLAECERQIARAENELRTGNPDIDGAGLWLHDWAAERRMILIEASKEGK